MTRPTSSTTARSAIRSAIAAFCSTSTTEVPRRVDLLDDLGDLVDDLRREPQRRLVEQQQLRAGHQRAADRDHLLLAAGEQPGGLGAPLAQAREQVEHGLELAPALRAAGQRHAARAQVLLDRQPREDAPALGHLDDARAHDLGGRRARRRGGRRTRSRRRRCGRRATAASRRSRAAACSCPRRCCRARRRSSRGGRRRRRRAARRRRRRRTRSGPSTRKTAGASGPPPVRVSADGDWKIVTGFTSLSAPHASGAAGPRRHWHPAPTIGAVDCARPIREPRTFVTARQRPRRARRAR